MIQTIKSLTAERKAALKEAENLSRFETHCLLMGITPTETMRDRMRIGCLEYFEAHNDAIGVPGEVLRSFMREPSNSTPEGAQEARQGAEGGVRESQNDIDPFDLVRMKEESEL